MAAPHVSGIATMCFAVNPSLSGAQVKNIIVNTATTTVTDHNSKDTWTNAAHKELLTYRMVDARRSSRVSFEYTRRSDFPC